MKKISQAVKGWAEKLLRLAHAEPVRGGLEISDAGLYFVRRDGERFVLLTERLLPGVIEEGRVKKVDEFVRALGALKAQILGKPESKRPVSVVVSIGSLPVYSQTFTLPLITGEDLENAVELNLQMVSPADLAENYAGWQITGKDRTLVNFEIMSAFAGKEAVDAMRAALKQGGFSATVVEFRALALARLLREAARGIDHASSYLFMVLDAHGLDSILIRGGQFYFEYFNQWKDIFQSEEREVALSVFETAIVRNMNQVMNFYSQHWPDDKIAEVLISAAGLTDEAVRIVKENFALEGRGVSLKYPEEIAPEWFVSVGSALRAAGGSEEINFLGGEAEREFRKEHFMNFLDFWKVAAPLFMGLLVALFVVADLLLVRAIQNVPQDEIVLGAAERERLAALTERANEFNRTLQFVRQAKQGAVPQAPLLTLLKQFTDQYGITLTRVTMKSGEERVSLGAEASSRDDIRLFSQAFETHEAISDVTVPLQDIVEVRGPHPGYGFSMSFSANFEIIN